MIRLKSASNKSVLKKLRNFSNFFVKKIFKMTELQLISKLSEMEQQQSPTQIRIKAPKRILHFSDGILEEYSSDDEVDGPSNQNKQSDEVKLNEFIVYCESKAYPHFKRTSLVRYYSAV